MRTKKDQKLQEMFGSLRGELPAPSVTDKAKAYLEAKNRAQEERRERRVRRPLWQKLAVGAALCAVCIGCVVGYQQVLQVRRDLNQAQVDAERAPVITTYYTSAQLGTRLLPEAELPAAAKLTFLDDPDVQVGEVREYFLKDETPERRAFVSVKARFRYNRSYVDVQICIELIAESYRGFDAYRRLSDYATLEGVAVSAAEDGEATGDAEYVTAAYFERGGLRWYVDTLSPERGSFNFVLQKILGG